jgi:hypothetical protein
MSKPKVMRVKREKAVKAPPDKAVAKESAGKEEKDEPVVKGKGAPEPNPQSPQEQWSDWIWSEERSLYYRAKKSSPGTAIPLYISPLVPLQYQLTKRIRNLEIRIRRASIDTGITTPALHLTKGFLSED